MKNKILLALFLVLPMIAQATDDQSTTTFKVKNLARDIKSQLFRQVPGISLHIGEGSDQVSGNSGLGIRFTNAINQRFGFDWGINLDTSRSFLLVTTDPSITYSLNSRSYLLAGFNYAVPTNARINSVPVRADWGLQYGFGYLANLKTDRQWAIEVIYRQVNLQAQINSEDLQFAGLQVRTTYFFN